MGDDTHQPLPLAQLAQGLYGLLKGLVVQGAEALIHKHGVQLYPTGGGLNLVRQPQGQRQGGQEGLAAGQGLHPLRMVPFQ